MTIFLDGPAANTFSTPLLLKRAPHFLRAVQAPDGTWDALDQLDDTPKPEETVVAYVMVTGPRSVHICARGKNNRSGWYQGGDNRVVEPQPTDAQLRDTTAWRAWVAEQVGKPIDAATGAIQEEKPTCD